MISSTNPRRSAASPTRGRGEARDATEASTGGRHGVCDSPASGAARAPGPAHAHLPATGRLVITVEGKRTESLLPPTDWYPARSQLVRNLEAARQVAHG